jgi:hypothetical protein
MLLRTAWKNVTILITHAITKLTIHSIMVDPLVVDWEAILIRFALPFPLPMTILRVTMLVQKYSKAHREPKRRNLFPLLLEAASCLEPSWGLRRKRQWHYRDGSASLCGYQASFGNGYGSTLFRIHLLVHGPHTSHVGTSNQGTTTILQLRPRPWHTELWPRGPPSIVLSHHWHHFYHYRRSWYVDCMSRSKILRR